MKKFTNILLILAMMMTIMIIPNVAYGAENAEGSLPAPASVKASTVDYNSIKIRWSAVKGADSYEIYRYSSATKSYKQIKSVEGKTYYTDNGLKYNRKYTYKVVASAKVDGTIGTASGTSVQTTSVSSGYSAKTTAATSLGKVKSVKSTAKSSTSIKVSWKKVAGADGYKVYIWSSSKDKYVLTKKITKASTTSFTDTGLKTSKSYAYKVAAYRDGITADKSAKTKSKTKSARGGSLIVSKAKTKLGSAYVSGAAGPNCFDCSGYVYWVYKYANATKVKFSRSSAAGMYSSLRRYKVGSSISSAKKGDIVFYSSGGYINHVGIYYGDGKVIHAANPRKGVCISYSSAMRYSGQSVCAVVRLPYKK